MNLKLYYYNPYITFKGKKTNIPLFYLIDKIIVLIESNRFKQLNIGEYSLIKLKDPRKNKDISDRAGCFADYRARKPKSGQKGTDRYEEIKSDVFETTNFFYQHSEKLFILEYNHHGAKVKHIKAYLESFLPKTKEPTWGIEFEELKPKIGLDDVLNSNDIRLLDIKLDVNSTQRNLLLDTSSKTKSVIYDVLQKIMEVRHEIGGNVADFSMGNGRKKDNPLNKTAVKDFMRILDYNSNMYISIKTKYYSPQLKRINEIDLKNINILQTIIESDGDSWEVVADTIENHFYDEGRNGAGQQSRFNNEIISLNRSDWF